MNAAAISNPAAVPTAPAAAPSSSALPEAKGSESSQLPNFSDVMHQVSGNTEGQQALPANRASKANRPSGADSAAVPPIWERTARQPKAPAVDSAVMLGMPGFVAIPAPVVIQENPAATVNADEEKAGGAKADSAITSQTLPDSASANLTSTKTLNEVGILELPSDSEPPNAAPPDAERSEALLPPDAVPLDRPPKFLSLSADAAASDTNATPAPALQNKKANADGDSSVRGGDAGKTSGARIETTKIEAKGSAIPQNEAVSSVLRDLRLLQAEDTEIQLKSTAPSGAGEKIEPQSHLMEPRAFSHLFSTQLFGARPNLAALLSSLSSEQKTGAENKPEAIAVLQGPSVKIADRSSLQDSTFNHGGGRSSGDPQSEPEISSSAKADTAMFTQAMNLAAGQKVDVTANSGNSNAGIPIQVASNGEKTHSSATAPETLPTATHTSLPVLHGPEFPANRFVNDAQLLQSATHSEMRIAMQTDKFGTLELRTHMAGEQIGAAITVEKRDAHAALAVELPALQQALSEKQLKVEEISLLQGSFNATTGDPQGHAQQGEKGLQRVPQMQSLSGDVTANAGVMASQAEQIGIFNAVGRLSVRA